MPPKKTVKSSSKSIKVGVDGYLVIVESPSKCKKIEEYLGAAYRCISSKGHFREIGGLKNIDTKHDFKCSYRIIETKEDHVAWMRSIISTYLGDNIFLASDDDREGEAIAWHICDEFGLDVATTKRIVFREITCAAIQAAVSNPRHIDMNLVAAQHARQVLDLVVGYRISPALWRAISNSKKNSLSAGRCQTPALRLVYERELQIRAALNDIRVQYRVVAAFFDRALPFVLQSSNEGTAGLVQGDRAIITTEKEMLEFIERSRDHSHRMELGAERVSTRGAPKPLTTSKLLQAASSQLSLSPKRTMELAQILYQSGLITYMRTENTKYSSVFLAQAREFILKKYSSVAMNPEKWLADFAEIENRDSANPHEAIRPTNLAMISFDNENAALVKLYQFIWRTTVESCLAPAKYNTANITITSPYPENKYVYGWESPIFLGWKIVEETSKSDTKKYEESRDSASTVPPLFYFQTFLASGAPVPLKTIEAKCVEKNAPPAHYTEASLIQKLEDLGIGRPSTFSSLVETIQDRGYVLKADVAGREMECTEFIVKYGPTNTGSVSLETIPRKKRFGEEKGKLVLQPIGEITIEYLIRAFEPLFRYEYTGQMERALDVIASSSSQKQTLAEAESLAITLCRECYDEISGLLKSTQSVEKETPEDPDSLDAPVHLTTDRVAFPVKGESNKHIIFHPYGISVRITETPEQGGEPSTKYVNVRPDFEFDVETARRGEYTFAELVESGLGEYEGYPLQIKRGKYGEYVQWNTNTLSLKASGVKPPYTRHKIVEYIESKMTKETTEPTPKNKMILLELDEHTSVRNGKYGPYIFHQPPNQKKPDFHSLKGFKGNVESREDILKWIDTKIIGLQIKR